MKGPSSFHPTQDYTFLVKFEKKSLHDGAADTGPFLPDRLL
jgi:hypothetical protein